MERWMNGGIIGRWILKEEDVEEMRGQGVSVWTQSC